MSFRRFRAIARKEFLHILRDPRSLAMSLALPVVMMALFGYALTLDVDRIPLALFDQDRTPDSRELASRFSGSRYFDLVTTIDNYAEAEALIDRGTCLAVLTIPRNYGADLRRGDVGVVQLLLDGTDSNTASIALGYATGITADWSQQIRDRILEHQLGRSFESPLQLRPRIWYNTTLESKNYIVPGLIAVILMIIAALLTSLTIAREWEMGTMEQLLSSPVRPLELVLGKMSAYFALGMADTLLAVVLGVFVFGVPLRGNLLLLAVSCFVFMAGALCWGIFLSATVRSQLLAFQLGMVSSFLPAFLLSGFVFAIQNMPVPVQAFTYVIPARYFVTVLKDIFLKGVGMSVIGIEILFLTIFAVVVALAATQKVKGKIA
ncbi:MAG: ABC transporter permease [Acidobacteriota bacterium]